MNKRIVKLFAILISFLIPALTAAAQSADFIVSQLGKPVGTASYSFQADTDGYVSTALVHVAMEGLHYSLSKTEQLTSANVLRHVVLSAMVNGTAISVTGAPDAQHFLLNISANGHSATTPLEAHRNAIFLADFDPGALETLLALAVTQNNRDLWAILPKQAGSVEAVQLATFADEQGTLDGKTVVVHHLVATIAENTTHLFSGPENQLLQAELPQQGFSLVRKGFLLTAPAKAPTPGND